jgi:2-polyprenyl-3-methyl-5-hydroxy-6-metoxy-1,4-benzoquinol methylase
VQYHEDGTTYWANPSKLRVMQLATQPLVVSFTTSEYRQAALHNTEQRDVVLEIGCHVGITTHMLAARCSGVVGIDMAPEVIQIARTRCAWAWDVDSFIHVCA